MRDNDLSTYSIIYFDSDEGMATIEVQLYKSYIINSIKIYGDPSVSLNNFQVYVGERFFGYCGDGWMCDVSCSYQNEARKILFKKYLPKHHDYTTMKIYEIVVDGTEVPEEDPDDDAGKSGGMSAGTVAGMMAGIICVFLLIIVWGRRWAKRKEKMNRFLTELCANYAVATSRGVRSGQFEIQHHHPDKKLKFTLFLRRGWKVSGPKYPVDFVINADRLAEEAKIMVEFNETGDESETRSNEVEVNEDIELALTLGDTDVINQRGREESREGIAGDSGTTVEARSVIPSAPEMTDLPPSSYQESPSVRVTHDIPTYEEVIANSAAFPEVKPDFYNN